MIELILYSRAGCELCHEMEILVEQEMARFEARLEKIDIDGNPELKQRFDVEVPVLFVNGRKAFKYRCTPTRVAQAFVPGGRPPMAVRKSSDRIVFVTAANEESAAAIGRALVEERLAACANLVGPIRSIYRWKDNVEDATEHLLIIKTRASLYAALEKRVKELHSYEVPEIIAVKIESGSPEYLHGSTNPRRACAIIQHASPYDGFARGKTVIGQIRPDEVAEALFSRASRSGKVLTPAPLWSVEP